MIRRPPRSTRIPSSAASDVYKRQLFSRRKSETEVRMNVLVREIATDKIISSRGVGTIQTDISAAGLQIEEDLPFNQSEFGGAIRKAIDEAMKQYK